MTAALVHADERACHAVIAAHGKSFALAGKLLPSEVRDDAVVLYAYCRRADDAVDLTTTVDAEQRLHGLRHELDRIYGREALPEPLLAATARVLHRRRIPRAYLDALLDGLAQDVRGERFDSFAELARYGYRVAGTVGLMMCHVMGVRSEAALVHAAHLGIAMQLTNIARDVGEDWQRGRLYLPACWLAEAGAGGLARALPGPLPERALPAVAAVTERLLARADLYYASGDAGLCELSPRCALAIRGARALYAAIGDEVRAQGCDPRRGRAVLGRGRKLRLLARAALATLVALGRQRAAHSRATVTPRAAFDARAEALVLGLEARAGGG